MPAPDGRNVLFVVLDTVRKDHLTPYGYDRPTTPALERFAREALVYENAVAQAPWTLPVHASMFTGRYPSEHTATQESPYLPEDVGTLAEALAAVGYRTACFSSNAWITPYTRLTAGFDEHDSFFEALPGGIATSTAAALWQRLTDGRLRPLADRAVEVGNVIHERLAARRSESKTPAIVDRTRRFVGDTDGRWFAFVNLMDAHLPYYPPEEYRATFAPNVDPNGVCQNSKSYNAGARSITEAEFDSIRRLYDAELRHMDAELDRLFEWLKRADRWEDTVVIVCADHGELHGEFGLYGHEFAVYDPLINVPLVMKHPDLPAGRIARSLPYRPRKRRGGRRSRARRRAVVRSGAVAAVGRSIGPGRRVRFRRVPPPRHRTPPTADESRAGRNRYRRGAEIRLADVCCPGRRREVHPKRSISR